MGDGNLIMVEEILSFIIKAVDCYVKNFGIDDIDKYLNVRDETAFDKSWGPSQAEIAISTAINKNDLIFQNQEKLLREKVFKSVAKLTHHYELAEYISDDAGLIFASQYFNVNNEFANWLLENYKDEKLPQ